MQTPPLPHRHWGTQPPPRGRLTSRWRTGKTEPFLCVLHYRCGQDTAFPLCVSTAAAAKTEPFPRVLHYHCGQDRAFPLCFSTAAAAKTEPFLCSPLPPQPKQRLSCVLHCRRGQDRAFSVCSTAVAAKTPPLPCVFPLSRLITPPLPCTPRAHSSLQDFAAAAAAGALP